MEGLLEYFKKPEGWHNERKNGVWASMVPAILGMSVYKDNTAEKLFDEIVNGSDYNDEPEGTLARGNHIEFIVREFVYPELTGKKIRYFASGYTCPTHDFLHAHLDGLIVDEGAKVAPWECKSYNREVFNRIRQESLHNDTIIQVNAQILALGGADYAYVTVFNADPNEWCCLRNITDNQPHLVIRQNRELCDMILEYSEKFWKNVQSRTRPTFKVPGIKLEKTATEIIGKLDGEEWSAMAKRYLEINQQAKVLEAEKDGIAKTIREITKGYNEVQFDGGEYVKWITSVSTPKLDEKLLKAKYPELDLTGCYTESSTSQSLRFYAPKKSKEK